MLNDIPNSPEELTAFYLREGKPLFEWCHENNIRETDRSKWIIDNKHWAVDEVTMKLSKRTDDIPVLVIVFSSSLICFNRVILAMFRTDWAREELFDGFGLTGERIQLVVRCKEHYSKTNRPLVVYTKG